MEYARSPELMNANDTLLLVVDVQERLMPHIFNASMLQRNIGRLLDAAEVLGVKVLVTEQYPKGLGTTIETLAARLKFPVVEKISFSCGGDEVFRSTLATAGRRKVLVCGIETHVCICQTVFDLLADGFSVYLAADSCGARKESDHALAIRRMENAGVTITSTEASLFEWCERAGTPEFKAIQKLVTE